MDLIKNSFLEAQQVLEAFISDEKNLGQVKNAGDLLVDMFRQGGKVFSCGNGGSLCDAMHFAEEMTGRFRNDRPPYAAIAISDPSHMACVGNDYGYEAVFSRYVEGVAKKGDVLLAISTSGTSRNILAAVRAAKAQGVKVIGLTGRHDSPLEELADVAVVTPAGRYADRVQELHIKVIHILIEQIEAHLFAEQ